MRNFICSDCARYKQAAVDSHANEEKWQKFLAPGRKTTRRWKQATEEKWRTFGPLRVERKNLTTKKVNFARLYVTRKVLLIYAASWKWPLPYDTFLALIQISHYPLVSINNEIYLLKLKVSPWKYFGLKITFIFCRDSPTTSSPLSRFIYFVTIGYTYIVVFRSGKQWNANYSSL